MERCPSVVVVVRRFVALIPWSFGDTSFLFVFKLHNLPYWRRLCALFVFFLMISKFAFGQGMYVRSSSLSVGCQIWEYLLPLALIFSHPFKYLSFRCGLEFVYANKNYRVNDGRVL